MVGVAPAGFSGMVPGIEAEFWVPVMMIDRLSFQGMQGDTDNDPGTTRLQRRGQHWLFVKARLATGRTVEQARSQVDTIFARLRKDYPITNEKARATVLPGARVRNWHAERGACPQQLRTVATGQCHPPGGTSRNWQRDTHSHSAL